MIITASILEGMLRDGRIEFDPKVRSEDLRPFGVRVHLGRQILVAKPGQVIDVAGDIEPEYDEMDISTEPLVLRPGDFVLGSTVERLKFDKSVVCFLDGRSTLARIGLTVHLSATMLDHAPDSWFRPVLEISNLGNLTLRMKEAQPIAMLFFAKSAGRGSSRTRKASNAQYEGQDSTTRPNFRDSATRPLQQEAFPELVGPKVLANGIRGAHPENLKRFFSS